MAKYIIMPKLGFNMDKGKIVKWLKNEGEQVSEQEVILHIETDKTVIEVESPVSGILKKILVKEGEEVSVTLPIAIIANRDEDINSMINEARKKLEISMGLVVTENNVENAEETVSDLKEKARLVDGLKEGFKKISPRAKRRAKELGIDIQDIKGSRQNNSLLEKDILEFYANQKTKKKSGAGKGKIKRIDRQISYDGIRKVIGKRLSESKFTAPHVYFTVSVDMSKAIESIKYIKKEKSLKISINDLIIFATAKVLAEQPQLNCSLVNERIIYYSDINIGVAVSLKDGLIVPVIRNANLKSLPSLSKEIKRKISLAKQKKIMPCDYEGGTFTVSNLGMYGIEQFTAIINPPEAAILAVGSIQKMPVATEENKERIEIRSIMKITLSADHRLIDGVMASNFLNQIKDYLLCPESLIMKYII
jgi:pyruvate dehydrogenase E2 component (dihydrolipoamide acetyltransferase)